MSLTSEAPNVLIIVILFFCTVVALGLAGIVLKVFGIGKNGD